MYTCTGAEDNVERGLLARNDASSPTASANVQSINLPEKNYKAIVQEYCQKHYLVMPEYVTEYPSDATGFVSVLTVNGKEYHSKPMSGKKKAEQDAAGRAAVDIGLVKLDSRLESYTPVNGSVSGPARRFTNGDAAPASYSSTSLGGGGASIRSRYSARTPAVPESEFNNKLQLSVHVSVLIRLLIKTFFILQTSQRTTRESCKSFWPSEVSVTLGIPRHWATEVGSCQRSL